MPLPTRLAFALLLASLPAARGAQFRLASIFGNGMVLQRNAPVTIWGFAEPSSPVFSTLTDLASNATFNASGVTSSSGTWSVSFPPQTGGYEWQLSVSDSPEMAVCAQYPYYCEGAFAEIHGVVFGDVIMCIGQSNMQVNVGFVFNASQELNASSAFWGLMKIFQVQAAASSTRAPLDDFAVPPQQPWSPAGPDTLPEFSATCYFSAKSLILSRPETDRDVVLGLVAAPWGGTPIRTHAPLSVNASCGSLYPESRAEQGCGMYHAPCAPAAIYNAMLAPVSGAGAALPAPAFPVAAFIWFQGENDASDAGLLYYPCELAGLAAALRAAHGSPQAHWVTVELAPYTGGTILAPFRAMQCAATATAIHNSSCASLVDGGDPLSPIGSVHSRNKQLVGRRVAAALSAALYGAPPLPTPGGMGPTFAGATLYATPSGVLRATVRFAPASLAGGALVLNPPHESPWSNSSRCPTETGIIKTTDCGWFEVVGSDGLSYNASEVVVGADGVTLELAAQAPAGTSAAGTAWGWNAWPVVSFYNAAGLPMVPWRVTAA